MFAITDSLKYSDLHLLWSKGTGAKLSIDSLSSTKHSLLHLTAQLRSYEHPFSRSPKQVLKHRKINQPGPKQERQNLNF